MLVLGIETTCDETAAAVIERQRGRFGPHPVERRAFADQGSRAVRRRGAGDRRARPCRSARRHRRGGDASRPASAYPQLDGVAAAAGPGLIGGVIVGLTTAKAIALVHRTPLLAINHLEAHALTPRLVGAARLSLLPVPRLGRPHPDRRRARRRQLCAARHHGRRCDRRGIRQGRQAARPAVPRRPAGGTRRRERRRRALRLSAADARTRGAEFLTVGPEDRRAAGGRAHRGP